MKRLAAAALLLGICLLASPLHAKATTNSPSGLTITPFLQNIAVDPSAPSTSFNFSVTNNTAFEQSLGLSIVDFGSLNETGGIAFAGSNANNLVKKYGLSSWLSTDLSQVMLPANRSTTIHAMIENKPTLQPGGHYAAILVSTASSQKPGANNVALQGTVATLVLATKVGGEKYDLHLDKISHNGNIFKRPTKATLRFKNQGNVHLIPRGTVKLLSGSKLLGQGTINDDSEFILPETYRQVYVPLRSTGSSWQPFNIYKLQVNYRYDGLNRFATKTYQGVAINLPALVLALVVIYALYKTVPRLWRYVSRLLFGGVSRSN